MSVSAGSGNMSVSGKKIMVGLLALTCGSLFLSVAVLGCGRSGDEEEGFGAVKAYAAEIIPAAEETLLDLEFWVGLGGPPDILPILEERAARLTFINAEHLEDDGFPSFEKVETWTIQVVRGQQEGTVQGETLADALRAMVDGTEAMAEAISRVPEGDMGRTQLMTLDAASTDLREALRHFRRALYPELFVAEP